MKQFILTYNGVTDADLPPDQDINKFVPGWTIAVQFQLHLLNFWPTKNLEAKFEYIFWMVSLYLV